MAKPTITFVCKSEALKERQLKAFAASIDALGQKLEFDSKRGIRGEDGDLLVVGPAVPMNTASSLPNNSLVLRPADGKNILHGSWELFLELLEAGIDFGLLGHNDYMELPAIKSIFLSSLGIEQLDLTKALPWGTVVKEIKASKDGFSRALKEFLKLYGFDAKLMEELSGFTHQMSEYFQHRAAHSDLVFLCDGETIGLIKGVQLSKRLGPHDALDILKAILVRNMGQLVINMVEENELKIGYYISISEELTPRDPLKLGWFVVGSRF